MAYLTRHGTALAKATTTTAPQYIHAPDDGAVIVVWVSRFLAVSIAPGAVVAPSQIAI
jgi:hypothetical protein